MKKTPTGKSFSDPPDLDISMRIALYQPDIPGNAGAVMRTAACLGVGVDIIGPSGFAVSDRKLRRAGMDYLDRLDLADHVSWEAYQDSLRDQPGRLVLLTTKAERSYLQFTFRADDILLLGRESAGVPEEVHDAAEHAIKVPMAPGTRSLNVAQALAMVLGEALRQTEGFPEGRE
jgi:tRNA (cytidine/uridine-2'-O-)-methyltransferase|tara:strand:- start:3615 stop:4139 length:525 start_codon:yes stop_codon:yes gene_type:complete